MHKFAVFSIVAWFSYGAFAQSTAELNQRLGHCGAQLDRTKRSQCFEHLSKDAIAALEKVATLNNTASTKAADALAPPQLSNGQYAGLVSKAKAKANATNGLLDPASVQWRNLYVSNTSTRPSRPVLCGEMNAKNSYGAFIGFRRFFAGADPEVKAIDTEKQPGVLAEMWDLACKQQVDTVQ